MKISVKAGSNVEFGRRHDRFMLGQQLSNCGTGEVRVCTRLANNEGFAVKIINRRAVRSSPRQEVLLRREIRTLRELNHPNVVRLHDAVWEEGFCFIVMDLAREGDLREKILRHKGLGSCAFMSEVASKYVARQLIAGIIYMHSRRVIHRDLKAENILVIKTQPAPGDFHYSLYDVKIADFGLSTWLDIVGELLTPCGTPNYLAPEIMKDNYDERIDFWSFGVVLYMMLCGDFPFEMYHDPSEMEHILQQSVKKSVAWQQISDHAKDFVCGLLVFDPDLRLCHGNCLKHVWMSGEGGDEAFISAAPMAHAVISPTEKQILDAPAHAGAVAKVTGWIGAAVDSIQLHWRDGSSCLQGGLGGFTKIVYNLSPGEIIIGVAQETRDANPQNLGNAMVLYTTFGRVLAFQGSDAWQRRRFVAPTGSQIVGLQFVGPSLMGIHLLHVTSNRGAVACISGRTGFGVDQILLELRDGSARQYGGEGGFDQGPWSLAEDEIITVVEQSHREEFLGNSVAFYTSSGNVYQLSGMAASCSRRCSAPTGWQICTLEFDGNSLSCVGTCPAHVCNPEPGRVEFRSLN